MCGFTGIVDFGRGTDADRLRRLVVRARDTLVHRGPDDAGVWVDASAGVALGHRRLSILDLSALGHQPMTSASGRYVVAYNGEVYNHAPLRRELVSLGAAFRGSSDTEVLLAAVEQWGWARTLKRIDGMFALALWDRSERALFLARDRFGEKPLYYALCRNTLIFGSELKALRAYPSFDAAVDRGSVAQLLRFAYVPAPRTIFQRVRKLPAATWLRVATAEDVERAPTEYWSLRDVAREGLRAPFGGPEEEARGELDRLLRASIRRRMVADVPVGAFLSGGIDSSTIVALMQDESRRPVRTFTIGFTEESYDESRHAKAVARHLGTDHTELVVTPEEARAVIPLMPTLYDEPFADESQVPTFLVARLARSQVTVALSGDGGDELFGGYNRYTWADAIWRKLRWLPRGVRSVLGRAMLGAGPSRWARVFESEWAPPGLWQRNAGDKLQKLAEAIAAPDADALYRRLASTWKDPAHVVLGAEEPRARFDDALGDGAPSSFVQRMMYVDSVTYLPDDILVKVDRATMGVSLESRVPYLEPEVAAFAWSLPLPMKVAGRTGKVLLRRVLAQYVPERLFARPKMGFGIPFDVWLRGPLRGWAESMLDAGRLKSEAVFDPAIIRARWEEHLRGERNWQYALWIVLMFQAWRETLDQRPEVLEGAALADDARPGLA